MVIVNSIEGDPETKSHQKKSYPTKPLLILSWIYYFPTSPDLQIPPQKHPFGFFQLEIFFSRKQNSLVALSM